MHWSKRRRTVDTSNSNRFPGDVLIRGCSSSRWHPYAAPLRLWACRQGALRKPARVASVGRVWQSRLVAFESLAAAASRHQCLTVAFSRCLSASTQSVSQSRFRVAHSRPSSDLKPQPTGSCRQTTRKVWDKQQDEEEIIEQIPDLLQTAPTAAATWQSTPSRNPSAD